MSLARRTSPAGSAVVVATLNVRNTADRWRARAPLLVEQLVALDPDVVGLQEVRRFPGQARWIAREATRRRGQPPEWAVRTAYKSGLKRLWEGLAVLSRLPVAEPAPARLRLGGQSRVALRVTVELPDGRPLDVYTTHLADGDQRVRCAQAERLLAWMEERPDVPQVLVGDLNSAPGRGPLKILGRRLRSAHALVHGSEPARTLPGGGVLDYILVNELVTVLDAWVAFDRPSPNDPGLLPSDHFGLAASLTARPRR
ncbi:MAG TPA: endonuclease/exonuclease/phosphatase family protein [Acidimicrobiales bacterium]